MSTEPLDDLPEYICLSYTWGNEDIRGTIHCDGRVLSVTISLWNALLYVRAKFGTTVRFWADQITINQLETEEKKLQVPKMYQLYAGAAKVICWLGEGDEYTSLAFAALRRWEEAGEEETLRSELNGYWSSSNGSGSDDTPVHAAEKRGLRTLLAKPWFERVWTLQEIYVDRQKPPTVVCGMHEISWESMAKGFCCMWSTLPADVAFEALGEAVVHAANMFDIYFRRKGNRIRVGVSLSDLVKVTATRKASKRRDRIFGLIGIVEHEGLTYPAPDYDIECEQVFTSFTRAMIEQEGDLNALCVVGSRETRDGPSWALSPAGLDDPADPLLAGGMYSSFELRGATGKTRAMILPPTTPFDKELRLRGMRFGRICRIESLSRIWQKSTGSSPRWYDLMSRLEGLAEALALPETYEANGESVLVGSAKLLREVFWIRRSSENRLWYSFCQFRKSTPASAPSDDSADAITDGHWTPETLYAFAMQAFRFERATDFARRFSEYRRAGNARLIDWLDVVLSHDLARDMDNASKIANLAVTANNRLALVHPWVQAGDEIVLLMGGFLPFVLRPAEQEGQFRFLGEANVHGCLDGKFADECEALCRAEEEGNPQEALETFCLI